MPDQTNPPNKTPFQSAWLEFIDALRMLLSPRPGDRPLDQYLQFRNDILALVIRSDFLADLEKGWTPFTDIPLKPVGDLLLTELRAFPLAIEVAQAQEKPGSEEKGWVSRWLGRGSTITSSVKDLFGNAPGYVKNGLTLLGELLDLFKGD